MVIIENHKELASNNVPVIESNFFKKFLEINLEEKPAVSVDTPKQSAPKKEKKEKKEQKNVPKQELAKPAAKPQNKLASQRNIQKRLLTKKSRCGCKDQKTKEMIRKKYRELHPLPKGVKATDKVITVPNSTLSKLNPYLRSIVGNKYLNFPAYGNKMSLYIEEQNTKQVNEVLELNQLPPTPVTIFSPEQKQMIRFALQQNADFLGLQYEEVFDRTKANYIIFEIESTDEGYFALASTPADLQDYPEIFLDQNIIFTVKKEFENFTATGVGSFFFSTMIHEIGHTLGFGHPFDTLANSTIMPGTIGAFDTTDQGFYYAGNTPTTIMAYCDLVTNFAAKNRTTLPRTLMTLDMQGLRFFYSVVNNQKFIDNWVNLSCPLGVTQTLVSTAEGMTLTLSPQREDDIGFNLNLLRYNVNPLCNNLNPTSCISSSFLGYDNLDANSGEALFSINIIDSDSFVKKVINSYPTLNVFAGTIENNCEIVVSSSNVATINLYFKMTASNYTVERTLDLLTVKYNLTGTILSVSNLNPNVTVSIFYSG